MTRSSRALRPLLRRARRAVLARRRPLAAVCAALAVAVALRTNAAPPEPHASVLTAARDLPAGTVLGAADLARTAFDPDSVPSGVLPGPSAAVGRTTTTPVRAGEPITDVRLLAASVLEGYAGLVAVPVRIGDADAVRLLRAGDRVDLLAADPQGERPARTVGYDVPVLTIPRPASEDPTSTGGALVVVGVPDRTARTLAQASVSSFLSVVITR